MLALALLVLALLILRRDKVRRAYHAVRSVLRDGFRRLYRASLRSRFAALVPERFGARGLWFLLSLPVLLLLLLPWSRSVSGRWVALPAQYTLLTAPIDGIVSDVFISERQHVAAGTPVLRIVNQAFDVARPELLRRGDSLRFMAAEARARRRSDASVFDARAVGAVARASALEGARTSGGVQAPSDGMVISPRPEMLLGRQVVAGMPLLQLGRADSLDVRIMLGGAGSVAVKAGQWVSMVLDDDASHAVRAMVMSVSPVAGAAASNVVEARVRLPASDSWRPGSRGAARVRIGTSTIGGALVWAIRTRLRGDLLL